METDRETSGAKRSPVIPVELLDAVDSWLVDPRERSAAAERASREATTSAHGSR